jgi:hypothetical protein
MNPAENLTWNADLTKLHGKLMPRSTAIAPDNRAAIELIGPPEHIRQISVAGEVVDEASARQVAAYMVMTVKLILPDWRGANGWLTDSMRMVKRSDLSITMQGWKLHMTWLETSRTVTLKATR